MNLCLSHHDQLRENAVQILYCMIISEYHTSQTFEHIENELVSKLDVLFMSDSKGDDISRTFFISHLRHLFDSSDVDEELRSRVTSFLESVNVFLQLLLSVRALPEGEEFADDRVMATVRQMRFGPTCTHTYGFSATAAPHELYSADRTRRDIYQIRPPAGQRKLGTIFAFMTGDFDMPLDASPIAELCRSRFDAQAAR